MSANQAHMLVVDDNVINRMLLTRVLQEQGYIAEAAENGRQALERLHDHGKPPIDVVLLDILMPELDGYETLEQIKQTPTLRHIPVIMISAVDEVDSAIRCIELGATDFLPKPFNPSLLRARISASLSSKRLRDLELEYLEQVNHITQAAAAVETATFDPSNLDQVAVRTDALGQLARVFQRMAQEVRTREKRLEQQVQELRIEIDKSRQAQQVQQITTSDYFQQLRGKAKDLRTMLSGDESPPTD